MRITPATTQPSSSGDRLAPMATATMALDTPESRRIWPKPPPAPTTSVMVAIGARHSLVNLRMASRLKPRARPKV